MSGLPPMDCCWRSLLRAAFLLLCAAMLFTGRGKAAPASSDGAPALSTDLMSHFAIADFDGDSRPDFATVQVGQAESPNVRYWIRFRMSGGSRLAIGVTAPAGGLRIEPRDVNGDRALDLIVTTAWLNKPVAVLVNDGHGGFTLNDPAAFPGIVWGAETYFTPAGDPWKDAAMVIPSRFPPGDFDKSSGVATERPPSELLVAAAAVQPFSESAIVVFGRAPPSFVLHT
jgi:hypothetical protein